MRKGKNSQIRIVWKRWNRRRKAARALYRNRRKISRCIQEISRLIARKL